VTTHHTQTYDYLNNWLTSLQIVHFYFISINYNTCRLIIVNSVTLRSSYGLTTTLSSDCRLITTLCLVYEPIIMNSVTIRLTYGLIATVHSTYRPITMNSVTILHTKYTVNRVNSLVMHIEYTVNWTNSSNKWTKVLLIGSILQIDKSTVSWTNSFIKWLPNYSVYDTFCSVTLLLLLSILQYCDIMCVDETTIWLVCCVICVCILLGSSFRVTITLLFVRVVCITTTSFLLFVLTFEITSIVVLYIIVVAGYNVERMDAGSYLFAYSLLSSTPMMVYLCCVYYSSSTIDISICDHSIVTTCYLLLFVLFISKLPLIYVHYWLVRAHVGAPTYGSILLVSILLKLGWYGCYRYLVTLHCELSSDELLLVWLICGCIGALTLSSLSSNSKRVVALSNVSHISTTQTLSVGTGISITVCSLLVLVHSYSRDTMFLSVGVLFVVSYTRCIITTTDIVVILFIPFLYLLVIVLGLPLFVGLCVENTHWMFAWLTCYLSTVDSTVVTGIIVVCVETTYLCGVILCNHMVLIGWLT